MSEHVPDLPEIPLRPRPGARCAANRKDAGPSDLGRRHRILLLRIHARAVQMQTL